MQRALLDARIRLAARLGCTLVVGMTEYGTASGRNPQRAGLGLVQVRTIWTAAPPGTRQNWASGNTLHALPCPTVTSHLIIDGFEGPFARVEWDARLLDLPRAWLPHAATEGDHLTAELTGDGCVRFEVDAVATRRARQAHQAQLDALNARDLGGDVDL